MRIEEKDARLVFQQNLKQLIRDSGIEQKEIAEKVGVSTSTVSDWVNGRTYPRVDAMQRLARLFGTSTELLVGRYEPDWKSFLPIAYQAATLEVRGKICKLLHKHYMAVGDDRELVGITKMLLDRLIISQITFDQACKCLLSFYNRSLDIGQYGCSHETYELCIDCLEKMDISVLDSVKFEDDINDDNWATLTLLKLIGIPKAPIIGSKNLRVGSEDDTSGN